MARSELFKIFAKGLGFGPAPSPSSGGHRIHEPFAGAWQRGIEVTTDSALSNPTAFRCVALVAGDIAKLRLTLTAKDGNGIWSEVESPAFSPVLRKPNRYQTRQQFIENWLTSKQIHGNTYALKERDNRGVVVALYLLDPARVKPLVGIDGSVWYEISADYLSGAQVQARVPAREVIHDRENAFYHPLCGLSPLYAGGLAAAQGNEISRNSAQYFANGSMPGGVLTHPEEISQGLADRYSQAWEEKFSGQRRGKVAVLANGLTYQPLTYNAVDSQLVEQIKASDEKVCSAFGVPAFMVGAAPFPVNVNVEALAAQYYAQRLQVLIEALESCLDDGLGLPNALGVRFDLSGLLRMDQATQAKALSDLVRGSIMAPNEARARIGLKPVKGGESPMAQHQDYSLAALAERDADKPFAKPAEAVPAASPVADDAKADTGLTEKLRPVMEGWAAEIAARADRRDDVVLKRLAKLESDAQATRAQVNGVVKALPSAPSRGGPSR